MKRSARPARRPGGTPPATGSFPAGLTEASSSPVVVAGTADTAARTVVVGAAATAVETTVVVVVEVVVVVVGAETVTDDADDVDTALDASPPYSAVSECAPTMRLLTEMLQVPAARVHVPIEVVPFLKVIVPVAVEATTVAVNVTDEPETGEVLLTVNDVVVDSALTTREPADDVEAPYVESPPYSAVNEWVPTGESLTAMLQVPDTRVHVPTEVEPRLKVTVPVAAEFVTAAVRVTDEPWDTDAELRLRAVVVPTKYAIVTLPLPSVPAVVIETSVADGVT